MNKMLKLFSFFCLLITFTSAFALKTKFDLTIYEKDLIAARIQNIERIKSHLNIQKESDGIVIKHVVTTGRNIASKRYVFLDIKTLESIIPKMHADSILENGKQRALTNAQRDSLVKLLKSKNVPKWLSDTNRKLYIHTVLQKKDGHKSEAFPISTKDSKELVKWAINHKQLYKEDHPAQQIKK